MYRPDARRNRDQVGLVQELAIGPRDLVIKLQELLLVEVPGQLDLFRRRLRSRGDPRAKLGQFGVGLGQLALGQGEKLPR
jgi:hypothetical protein